MIRTIYCKSTRVAFYESCGVIKCVGTLTARWDEWMRIYLLHVKNYSDNTDDGIIDVIGGVMVHIVGMGCGDFVCNTCDELTFPCLNIEVAS